MGEQVNDTGIYVYNPRCHQVGSQLIEILRAHFDCNVNVLEDYPPNLLPPRDNTLRLFFFIMDDASSVQELEKAATISGIWKLCVFCEGGCEAALRDVCFDSFDDFLYAPLREEEILLRLRKFMGAVGEDEKEGAKRNLLQKLGLAQIFGRDPAFLEMIAKIPHLARDGCREGSLCPGDSLSRRTLE
jgi:hypothetical protein